MRVLTFILMMFLFAPAWAQEALTDIVSYGREGKSFPVTVLLPPEAVRTGTPRVMITLPPGPGDAQMVKSNLSNYWAAEGLRRGYIVVAPEVFGRSLDQDADKFTDALFSWMDKNFRYDRTKVVLSGQSNGGIGAFFMAVARPARFAGVCVIPGQYLGQPGRLSALRGKPVWMIVGANDYPERWLTPVRETYQTLQKFQARVKLDEIPNQGHVPAVQPSSLYDWFESL